MKRNSGKRIQHQAARGLRLIISWLLILVVVSQSAVAPVANSETGRRAHLPISSRLEESPGAVKPAAPQCSFCISPLSSSFTHEEGNGSIAVNAPAGCNWTATSNDGFITITSGSSGSGNGMVSYTVAANTTGSPRTGTITAAGETFTVVQGIPFNDVPSSHLFYTNIGKLSARRITLGCGGGNYCPDQPVTREQMAAFILRALGETDPPAPATQRFADVPPTNPFYNFIDRLATLNITLGCGTDPQGQPLYCPTATVTREQMAAFIIRALGEFNPPVPASQRFADVPPANPFYKFIDRMAVYFITVGCGTDSMGQLIYCPTDQVTRGQMAAFLIRAFDQPINRPPAVSAGPDRTITELGVASLSGSVGDDGFPFCSTLSSMWSKVSGPGDVTFANPASATTTASFSAEGDYVLRLTASDSVHTVSDEMMVKVNPNDQQQDYNLTVAPSMASAVERTSATYIVHATSPKISFSQLVSLSATGLPAGATASFDPPQITAGASSTLTVNLVNANPGPGSSSFTIRGQAMVNGQLLVRTAPATLNVIAAGQTTLSGRVLSTHNEPIPGATASLDDKTATTDAAGAFLLVGVSAGQNRPVRIDGTTANVPNRTYPVIVEPADISAGQPNIVPYTFYLPAIDTQHEEIIVPGQDTMVENPRVPGLMMTVPADANMRNLDGTPVTRVSITPVEIDRTPAPLPSHLSTTMVFTSQPGGARPTTLNVQIPVVYPNLSGENPNTRVELYYFKHDMVVWDRYGFGRVSSDGRTIVPEINPATGRPYGLPDFSWHFPAPPPPPPSPPDTSPPCVPIASGNCCGCNFCPLTGQTVDLATGVKIEKMTDILFGGARGGITLTRTYTTGLATNGITGRFGRGIKDNYDLRLTGTFQFQGAGRFLTSEEGEGRLFSFARTDPDGALVFTTTATIGQLADVIRKLTDGTFEYRTGRGEVMRFDASGRLTAMIDRNANATTLSYVGGNLASITDSVRRSVTFTYDASNRVTTATDPLGRIWRFGYSAAGNLISVADPLGNVTRYTYDGNNRLTSVTDKRGIVVKQITYDGNGRVIQQQFADGGIERYAYELSGMTITEATVTDPLGRVRKMRFNSVGYVMQSMDALGQTTTIERHMTTNVPLSTSGPCGCVEAQREFDDRGNVTSSTDRLGQIERFEYEPVFNNIKKMVDKLGRVTTYTYDARGNRLSMTDALNQTTMYDYDQFGQMTRIVDPLGHAMQMEYDGQGNMTARIDALGHRTMFEYDGVGRLTATVDPLGRSTSMAYDALDRIVSTTDPANATTTFAYDPNGNQTRLTDALNKTWRNNYDVKNRLILRTDPVGNVTQFEYNAADERIRMISPSGRTTRYTYDARGQQETIIDPLGGVIRFTYDHAGNLTTLTDQRGNTTSFTYDELYRLTSTRDPLGQVTSLGYDAVGNVTEKIDRLGRMTMTTYDVLNRPTRIAYADAVVDFTYDAANRRRSVNDTQSGSIAWDYDAADRLMSETTQDGVVSYMYNAANQRISMTAGNRPPVNYGYDPAGRLQTISQGTETFTYSYDTISRLVSLQRPNNVTTTYQYDEANKLIRLTHAIGQNPPIEDFQYTYNADDEIASITSLASAQLLPAPRTVGPADAANRITQFGQSSYTFDAEGQTTSKIDPQGATSYEWDARGRLIRVALPNSQIVSYSYDALGRRVSRAAGGMTTRFLYDSNDVVLDRGSDGSAIDYLNGLGIDHKLRQASTSTGDLYFLLDHLGSTTTLANTAGDPVERSQYEAFGETQGSILTRYGYTGRERDTATMLMFYRARYYDPSIGRFISQDPFGFAAGLNLYEYVENGPLNAVDPTGHQAISLAGVLSWQPGMPVPGVPIPWPGYPDPSWLKEHVGTACQFPIKPRPPCPECDDIPFKKMFTLDWFRTIIGCIFCLLSQK